MSNTEKTQKTWESFGLESPIRIFVDVGLEAVSNAFTPAHSAALASVAPILQARLGETAYLHLDEWSYNMLIEAGMFGLGLGAALARIPMPNIFDAWLEEALELAGLKDFAVRSELELD